MQTKKERMRRKATKYKGNKEFKGHKSYKEKGKKTFFMVKDFDNSEDKIVYIAVKDESNDEGDMMALISHVRKNDTWIRDSGCSHHMTRDKSKFEHFEHYDGGSVRFGNNEPCCIKGKGHISLTNKICM